MPNEMIVNAKKGDKTRVDIYEFKLTTVENIIVAVATSSNTKATLNNVPTNTPLLLSVRAKNTTGISPFSEPKVVRLIENDDNLLSQKSSEEDE